MNEEGSVQELTVGDNGTRIAITWPDAEMTITASQAIEVTQTKLPDCTLVKPPQDGEPDHLHTCLVVRTPGKVKEIALATCVGPRSMGKE